MPNPKQAVLHDVIQESLNRPGRQPHPKNIAFRNRLYEIITGAFESGKYKNMSWSINDLASKLFDDDDYITPQETTHYGI